MAVALIVRHLCAIYMLLSITRRAAAELNISDSSIIDLFNDLNSSDSSVLEFLNDLNSSDSSFLGFLDNTDSDSDSDLTDILNNTNNAIGVSVEGVATAFPVKNNTFDYYLPPPKLRRDALLRRGKTRPFAVNDFKAIAASNAVLTLYQTATGGASLEAIPSTYSQTTQQITSGNLIESWSADHIFELQLLRLFFRQFTGMSPEGINWNSIWNQLQYCEMTHLRAVAALNTMTNLIGIPIRINRLKGILFASKNQHYPQANMWSNYFLAEVQALIGYLKIFHVNYLTVALRIADIMQLVYERGHQPQLTNGGAGSSGAIIAKDVVTIIFLDWAEDQFQAVMTALNSALDGARFAEMPQYSLTYKHDELR